MVLSGDESNPEFFEKFFIYEHYTRFITKDLGRYQPWYYFVPILLSGALPWTVLMFDSVLRAWRGGARAAQAFSPERFLMIWAVFIYLFFRCPAPSCRRIYCRCSPRWRC